MKIVKEMETRHLVSDVELRTILDGENEYIEGYALRFEKWSSILGGWFKEVISRDALNNTDMSNVVALFNHDGNMPLARNSISSGAGSLSLEVDNFGLKFRLKPTNTTYSKDLLENVRSGLISQCSFAFKLNWDNAECDVWEYKDDEGIYERRINDIKEISDISLVTTPAYPDTEAFVSQRSKDKLDKIKNKPNILEERNCLLLELDLLKM